MISITDKQKQQYRENGFFIVERAIPQDQLQMLRDEASRFVQKIHTEMDAAGTDTLEANIRDNRYFIANRYKESNRLHEFLFGDLMAEVCRATLGPNAFLFYEQFVLKAAEKGVHFSWHQDSGYVRAPHKPYMSCWCALDDVSEENGTVYMLPYSRAGTATKIEHVKDEKTNDLVGYHGDDPGEAVIVPAGSIAVFSSTCFHRSGVNTSPNQRRVYLAQYSPEAILRDGKPTILAEPFLKDGKRV